MDTRTTGHWAAEVAEAMAEMFATMTDDVFFPMAERHAERVVGGVVRAGGVVDQAFNTEWARRAGEVN